MSVLIVLAAAAVVVGLPAVVDLFRRSDLRRMAIRNAIRRPTESALIIIGSALGTAIIVAALMVGDTFDTSIRDIARRSLGEVDLVAHTDSFGDVEGIDDALRADRPDGVDGIMPIRRVGVAAAAGSPDDTIASSPDRPVEPRISLSAVDFDRAAAFGSDPQKWGLVGTADSAASSARGPEPAADPGTDGVVVNADLAQDLAVGVGERITVFVGGAEMPLQVTAVVDAVGLGGFSDAWVSMDLFDFAGVDDSLTADQLLVSLDGTVFDTAAAESDRVTGSILDMAIAQAGGQAAFDESPLAELAVEQTKQELLQDAADEGTELTTIFSVVGGFSVMAGALLLVNLFVMLAEERKPNLGVLRAIGWKRSALRRAFRVEGVVYAVPAAVVGAVLGIGVGWIIVQLTRGILAGQNPDSDFALIAAVERSSLLTAGLSGFVIAMVAVWFTSWRISRLNIVSAIRDLPEPRSARSRVLMISAGLLLVIAGVICVIAGLSGPNAYIAIVSVPVIVIGLALLLRDLVPPLWLTPVGAVIVLVWAVLIFEILPEDTSVTIEFFLPYGVVMVGAGVALATVSGTLLQRLISRSGSGGVPARLAMAYPTSRVFRTSSSLAMYSLIVFSLAFMAVMASGIEAQSSEIVESSSAGHDILVTTNRSNPLAAADLGSLDGVSSASAVTRTWTEWSASFDPETLDNPRGSSMTAADPAFAASGAPALTERDPRFATDREAFLHLLATPSALMVSPWFLGDGDGAAPSLGDTATAFGTDVEFEIIGILQDDFTWPGVWVNPAVLAEIDPEARPSRLYVAVDEGSQPAVVADRIEARFLPNGAEAETFTTRVARYIETDLGFFSLLRGYLLLGLVIGIGGLAVTLFRAVRERRRQIGMLRSMGLAGKDVGRWFLGEAAYISVMGIICGVGLGVLSAYFVNTRSTAVDSQLPFAVPWVVMAVLIVVPLAASGLAAVIPARRAAALRPSEALRLAD